MVFMVEFDSKGITDNEIREELLRLSVVTKTGVAKVRDIRMATITCSPKENNSPQKLVKNDNAQGFQYVDMEFMDFIELCKNSHITKLQEISAILATEYEEVDEMFSGYTSVLIERTEAGEFDYLHDEDSASLIGSIACAMYYQRKIKEQLDIIKKIKHERYQ